MPIYEYKCDLCNGLWEEIQKFSDDPLTVCKSCEKEGGVHKLLPGGMNFILRGDGWYKDGYSKPEKIGGVDRGEAQVTTDHQPDRQGSSSANGLES
jgi:putative FmdB family regulatory protein